MSKWEIVTTYTRRLRVPGGWLYRRITYWGDNLVFVPDPERYDER